MKLITYMLAIALLTSCAHKNGNTTEATPEQVAQTSSPELKEVEKFHLNDPAPSAIPVAELEEVPEEMQPMVDMWVAYFQGRGRPHMERYLSRSTRYTALMKKILVEQGLPDDLIYVSLIESGFNSVATSHAAAVGYWQFIRATGRRYGLEINKLVDERRDPVLATQAAGAYLKDLHEQFGSWYLAMASYNVGEGRVAKEIKRLYTNNFWDLVKKKRLPRETMNYVPKFIAARKIAMNPEQYGFVDIAYMDPIEFDHITVERPTNLRLMAEKMGIEYDQFKLLNPKFRGEVAPLNKANLLVLRVPVGQQEKGLLAAQESFVERVEYVADYGETKWYKIRSGDSLSTIARKFRTTVAVLRDLNDMNRKQKLRAGRKLMVPDRSGRKAVYVAQKQNTQNSTADASDEKVDQDRIEIVTNAGVFYYVQPGDTLSVIAERYNTNVANIRRMNDFSSGEVLKAGTKIKVPKSIRDRDDDGADDHSDRQVAAQSHLEEGMHVVKRGENLTLIAKKYGVTVQSIQKANNLGRRSVLKVGVRIVIPKTSTTLMRNKKKEVVHVVKRGENLHTIAKKYKTTMDDLKDRNQIKKASRLFVGAKLFIPNAQAAKR